jgi:hypothetical protein
MVMSGRSYLVTMTLSAIRPDLFEDQSICEA